LRQPDGSFIRLKVRSIVGLLPICATTVIEPWQRDIVPKVNEMIKKRMMQMPELLNSIHPTGIDHLGYAERGIVALVNKERLRRILTKMLDENEFLGKYGIRALSKYHLEHPYHFNLSGEDYSVSYMPAESDSGMFGGNSNWRGPIWFPINIAILRGLLQYYLYYGDNFKIECPTGSGNLKNLFEVAKEIVDRLSNIFLLDENNHRPVFGSQKKFQDDPFWRDNILFYEYFNGDNGAGLGASHQTGWTGLIARLIQLYTYIDSKKYLELGKRGGLFPESKKNISDDN
jgi:Glycosyl hydrolase family 63 C-terminal domain